MEAQDNLYRHPDGATVTRVKKEYKHIFEHSASASLFAYLPKSFWNQVLIETNEYAKSLMHTTYDLKKPFSIL